MHLTGTMPVNKVHLTRTVYLDENYINGTIYQRNDMGFDNAVCHNLGGQVAMTLVAKKFYHCFLYQLADL